MPLAILLSAKIDQMVMTIFTSNLKLTIKSTVSATSVPTIQSNSTIKTDAIQSPGPNTIQRRDSACAHLLTRANFATNANQDSMRRRENQGMARLLFVYQTKTLTFTSAMDLGSTIDAPIRVIAIEAMPAHTVRCVKI